MYREILYDRFAIDGTAAEAALSSLSAKERRRMYDAVSVCRPCYLVYSKAAHCGGETPVEETEAFQRAMHLSPAKRSSKEVDRCFERLYDAACKSKCIGSEEAPKDGAAAKKERARRRKRGSACSKRLYGKAREVQIAQAEEAKRREEDAERERAREKEKEKAKRRRRRRACRRAKGLKGAARSSKAKVLQGNDAAMLVEAEAETEAEADASASDADSDSNPDVASASDAVPTAAELDPASMPIEVFDTICCSSVFGDTRAKLALCNSVCACLEGSRRARLVAPFELNEMSLEDCRLVLRSLYLELRAVCADKGFFPDVPILNGQPTLELLPKCYLKSK